MGDKVKVGALEINGVEEDELGCEIALTADIVEVTTPNDLGLSASVDDVRQGLQQISNRKMVTQAAHGFTVPASGVLPVYYNNVAGAYQLAQADDIQTSADTLVVEVVDANNFIIQEGDILRVTHGLTVGIWYVLDPASAGGVVPFSSLTGTDVNVQYLFFTVDANTLILKPDPIFTRDFFIPQDISILEDWIANTANSVPLTAGTNRMLILNTSWEDDVANGVASITIGGVAGTLTDEQLVTSGFSQASHQFRWNEADIAAMSGNAIAITWNSGTPNAFGVSTCLLEHVDQVNPIVGTNTDSGTGGTDTLDADVNTVAGGYAVLVSSGGNEGMGFTNNGTGWTRKLNLVITSADGVVDDKLISADATPENVNMGITGSNRHVMVVSSFRRQE